MTFWIRRREFMAGLGAGLLASPAIVRAKGNRSSSALGR